MLQITLFPAFFRSPPPPPRVYASFHQNGGARYLEARVRQHCTPLSLTTWFCLFTFQRAVSIATCYTALALFKAHSPDHVLVSLTCHRSLTPRAPGVHSASLIGDDVILALISSAQMSALIPRYFRVVP